MELHFINTVAIAACVVAISTSGTGPVTTGKLLKAGRIQLCFFSFLFF